MMDINWKRVPRQGFIASHWVGTRDDGKEFSIWQKKPASASRLKNTREATLRSGTYSVAHAFPDVKAAKEYAENWL